ncbi:MAG TPA: hypothetical protein PK752_09980 [Accumulibacter sp.]|uniref:hypothetical protein n=1 Tax=Accumulibacter sp. TaxID=2053492 RepID=UPI002B670E02|nr:hypothetical protein [Accumulibacter sp.]HRD88566.1 hypothetical protein [Accumulibacter sp.]
MIRERIVGRHDVDYHGRAAAGQRMTVGLKGHNGNNYFNLLRPDSEGPAMAAGGTPVDHYLSVAGVGAASVTRHDSDLPPTEVLLDAARAADAGAMPHQAAVDDAAFAAVPVEVHHQPQDDPQHHGV